MKLHNCFFPQQIKSAQTQKAGQNALGNTKLGNRNRIYISRNRYLSIGRNRACRYVTFTFRIPVAFITPRIGIGC